MRGSTPELLPLLLVLLLLLLLREELPADEVLSVSTTQGVVRPACFTGAWGRASSCNRGTVWLELVHAFFREINFHD